MKECPIIKLMQLTIPCTKRLAVPKAITDDMFNINYDAHTWSC